MVKRLLPVLALVGCEATPPEDENRYTFRIIETEKVHEFCSAGNACYHHNTVFIEPVRGDWDTERMAALGHEVWHAMGNKHE